MLDRSIRSYFLYLSFSVSTFSPQSISQTLFNTFLSSFSLGLIIQALNFILLIMFFYFLNSLNYLTTYFISSSDKYFFYQFFFTKSGIYWMLLNWQVKKADFLSFWISWVMSMQSSLLKSNPSYMFSKTLFFSFMENILDQAGFFIIICSTNFPELSMLTQNKCLYFPSSLTFSQFYTLLL